MIKTLAKQIKGFELASILTPICMILEVVADVLIPFLMASIIDDGIDAHDMGHIYAVGGLMILVALFGLLMGLGGAVFGSRAATGFARNLRKSMFERIQTFSFANIDKFSTAGLITRLTTDATNIQMAYMMLLRMAFRAPVSIVAALVMSYIKSPKLATVYLVAVIILGVFMAVIMCITHPYFKKLFDQYDKLNESTQENITGIRVVKAYVREDFQTQRFKKASDLIYKISIKAEKRITYIGPMMQLTVYGSIMLISWLGARLIVQNELSTGDLMSLLQYCMNILMNLMMLSMIFIMVIMSSASAKRIAEVLDEEPTIKEPENPVYEVKDGSVRFENVSFSYRSSGKEDSDKDIGNVLSGINLDIKSGETIGVIGGTGSSKSSLVNLISRLYDAGEGRVLVGGVDVKDYDLTSLRDKVAVVLQKNVLFSGTIYDNLRWGKEDATEEECKRACVLACADEFISGFPDGYETHIEQGGSNVSGGQKQRLCIARALLKEPKVLILDDSTSAVDTATDARIRHAFATEIPGVTKIIIAQRIASVSECDRVIVMDNGRVDAFDTPEKLLENNVIYRDVYESQTAGNGDFDEGR